MNKTARRPTDVSEERRGFLRGLMATGSGVAVLAASTGSVAAAVADDSDTISEASQESKGYQVTQQVLDYYRTAAL